MIPFPNTAAWERDYCKEKGLNVVYEGKYPKDAKDLSPSFSKPKTRIRISS